MKSQVEGAGGSLDNILMPMSLTQHAYRKFRISSRIRIYMQKGFSPLIRDPGLMANEKN
jgi:hypothetical protein